MEKKGFKNISTKVNEESYRAMTAICAGSGLTVYQFLQMVVDTIIRYKDEAHRLSPELEQVMSVFEHMEGWRDSFNLAESHDHPHVMEATYYIGESGRRGCRAVHVNRSYFGDCQQTYNIGDILERTFCLMLPELYRKLRKIGVELGTNSIIQTIMTLIEDRVQEEDLAELRRQFDDNSRSQTGRTLASAPYRRKKRVDIEKIEKTQTIRFTEEDDNIDGTY